MGATFCDIADCALKLLPIVQTVAEHHLRMVVRSCFFKLRQLSEDIRRPLVA